MILVTAAVLVLLPACVLLFPRWLYPPLSDDVLRGITSADRRVQLEQAQGKLQNDARTTLLQGVAGLLLAIGAIATWRQVRISREQLEVARQQALESDRQAREQLSVARQGQITERFARAVDQLGSTNHDIQIGGILALERIARDSEADQESITRILEAFVRTHAPWAESSPEYRKPHPHAATDGQIPWLRDRNPEVQVCVIVLGRRVPSEVDKAAHLPRVDLQRSYLWRARLPDATLSWANLAHSEMSEIHLERGKLEYADLRHARIQGGFLSKANFRRAYLDKANLSVAHLRKAIFVEACLQGATFRGADLRGADLRDADLEGAMLSGACEDEGTRWPEEFGPDRRRAAGVVISAAPVPAINPAVGGD